MTTITRKQLISAVEAGIAKAQADAHMPDDEAVKLRAVAATTRLVGRGTYHAKTADGSRIVDCPFVDAYDNATAALMPRWAADDILEITDEPQSV
jgi:hypothetical protein